MITIDAVSVLGCPGCKQGGLELLGDAQVDEARGCIESGQLSCSSCGARYSIEMGVPDLVPEGSLTGESWQLWREHLRGYDARQQARLKRLSDTQSRRWADKLQAFLDFMQLPAGRVLDIGCGTGGLRTGLDPQRCQYFGIDPLPTPQVSDFLFVRSVAEALPFRSATFTSVVVRSALDHFCDLNGFFAEVQRVLVPNGRLYLEQSVHEANSPLAFAKFLAHEAYAKLEEWTNRKQPHDAPKHMNDFTHRRLLETCRAHFEIVETRDYNRNWYTPTQTFLALKTTGTRGGRDHQDRENAELGTKQLAPQ